MRRPYHSLSVVSLILSEMDASGVGPLHVWPQVLPLGPNCVILPDCILMRVYPWGKWVLNESLSLHRIVTENPRIGSPGYMAPDFGYPELGYLDKV